MENIHNYRKIWEQTHGSIPKDSDGRSLEIHHIDGNHSNNDISNLRLVTIQEHYDIHYSQGDFNACWCIAHRMDKSPEEIIDLAIKHNKKRIDDGTHHLLGSSKIARERSLKRVANGTHNFLGGEIQREVQKRRIENGTHHLLSGEIQKRSALNRIANGTHNFLGGKSTKKQLADGKHASQFKWTCPHCNKEGKGKGIYTRFHGNACKSAK